jgi:two-component system, OmpR family, phosphate regulon response regulator PhoB
MLADKTVLIVEEAGPARDIVRVALEMSNFNCLEASDAFCAHGIIIDKKPDLVLLDSLLPGQSGIELARRLRRDEFTAGIPIVMLTIRNSIDNSMHGMDVGADDYILKPVPPRELVARLKSVLRRMENYSAADPLFACGLCLNPRTHSVSINDKLISIGPTEYRLLEYFLIHQERVHSRELLLEKVWGGNSYVQLRTVDVHIRRLRKALSVDGHDRFVQTVRGAGYRFSHKHILYA